MSVVDKIDKHLGEAFNSKVSIKRVKNKPNNKMYGFEVGINQFFMNMDKEPGTDFWYVNISLPQNIDKSLNLFEVMAGFKRSLELGIKDISNNKIEGIVVFSDSNLSQELIKYGTRVILRMFPQFIFGGTEKINKGGRKYNAFYLSNEKYETQFSIMLKNAIAWFKIQPLIEGSLEEGMMVGDEDTIANMDKKEQESYALAADPDNPAPTVNEAAVPIAQLTSLISQVDPMDWISNINKLENSNPNKLKEFQHKLQEAVQILAALKDLKDPIVETKKLNDYMNMVIVDEVTDEIIPFTSEDIAFPVLSDDDEEKNNLDEGMKTAGDNDTISVELDVTVDIGEQNQKTWEADMKKAKIKWKLAQEEGPGGGWPVYHLTAKKKDLYNFLVKKYDSTMTVSDLETVYRFK